jgi:beta-fructofuranosidase
VVDRDGTPTIVYTSVDAAAPDVGAVALARGRRDWSGWAAQGPGPVLAGPPPELDLTAFRDPAVTPDGGGWRMVIGAGSRDRRGMALHYSSADLWAWRCDGVLAGSPAGATGPQAGSVWECPPLIEVDGTPVLLVSVWDGAPRAVAAALGSLDGPRFTVRAEQPFDAAGELYATTVFRDARGRPCALSWLPGTGPAGGPWAGLLSLPHLLSVAGGRLRARPHPDVDTLRGRTLAGLSGSVDVEVPPLVEIELDAGEPVALDVREDDGERALGVRVGPGEVVLQRPGRPDAHLLLDGASGRLRVLLDVGIAEVFTADGGVAVLRLDGASGGPLRLRVDGAPERLVVRELQRWFGAGSGP